MIVTFFLLLDERRVVVVAVFALDDAEARPVDALVFGAEVEVLGGESDAVLELLDGPLVGERRQLAHSQRRQPHRGSERGEQQHLRPRRLSGFQEVPACVV